MLIFETLQLLYYLTSALDAPGRWMMLSQSLFEQSILVGVTPTRVFVCATVVIFIRRSCIVKTSLLLFIIFMHFHFIHTFVLTNKFGLFLHPTKNNINSLLVHKSLGNPYKENQQKYTAKFINLMIQANEPLHVNLLYNLKIIKTCSNSCYHRI